MAKKPPTVDELAKEDMELLGVEEELDELVVNAALNAEEREYRGQQNNAIKSIFGNSAKRHELYNKCLEKLNLPANTNILTFTKEQRRQLQSFMAAVRETARIKKLPNSNNTRSRIETARATAKRIRNDLRASMIGGRRLKSKRNKRTRRHVR